MSAGFGILFYTILLNRLAAIGITGKPHAFPTLLYLVCPSKNVFSISRSPVVFPTNLSYTPFFFQTMFSPSVTLLGKFCIHAHCYADNTQYYLIKKI